VRKGGKERRGVALGGRGEEGEITPNGNGDGVLDPCSTCFRKKDPVRVYVGGKKGKGKREICT